MPANCGYNLKAQYWRGKNSGAGLEGGNAFPVPTTWQNFPIPFVNQ